MVQNVKKKIDPESVTESLLEIKLEIYKMNNQ